MFERSTPGPEVAAPPWCYKILDRKEFNVHRDELLADRKAVVDAGRALMVAAAPTSCVGYPAFQLHPRLNQSHFAKLREVFSERQTPEQYLWDFLRTVHKPLGGTTGIDFLLGYFSPEIADMNELDRLEQLLDTAREDLWRLDSQ
jgi:hypothetical protein